MYIIPGAKIMHTKTQNEYIIFTATARADPNRILKSRDVLRDFVDRFEWYLQQRKDTNTYKEPWKVWIEANLTL